MAVGSNARLTIGLTAAGIVAQYNAVTSVGAVASAAGNAVGFAQTGAAAGQRFPVTALGTAIAIAGAAIALGAALEVGSSGQVVTKAAGITVGRALNAASGVGDQVEVLLIPN